MDPVKVARYARMQADGKRVIGFGSKVSSI